MNSIPLILADERRIKQVILNILTNAIKFSNVGGRIEITAEATKNGGSCFVITDNGIGMDAATKDNALQIFGRGDQPMIRKIEGVGLGLHLSNAIVEAHGGTLTIDSTLGLGTAVKICLPGTAAP